MYNVQFYDKLNYSHYAASVVRSKEAITTATKNRSVLSNRSVDRALMDRPSCQNSTGQINKTDVAHRSANMERHNIFGITREIDRRARKATLWLETRADMTVRRCVFALLVLACLTPVSSHDQHSPIDIQHYEDGKHNDAFDHAAILGRFLFP